MGKIRDRFGDMVRFKDELTCKGRSGSVIVQNVETH